MLRTFQQEKRKKRKKGSDQVASKRRQMSELFDLNALNEIAETKKPNLPGLLPIKLSLLVHFGL